MSAEFFSNRNRSIELASHSSELLNIEQAANALRAQAVALAECYPDDTGDAQRLLNQIDELLQGKVEKDIAVIDPVDVIDVERQADQYAVKIETSKKTEDLNLPLIYAIGAAGRYIQLAITFLESDPDRARDFCDKAMACQLQAETLTDEPIRLLTGLRLKARIIGTQVHLAQQAQPLAN